MSNITMRHLLKWVKDETISLLPAIIYFCIMFNIIYFTSGLILQPDTPRYFSYFTVTLLALVCAKVILIANALPFINLFSSRPLIYQILWKFFIYAWLLVVLWMAETMYHLEKYDSFAQAFERLMQELLTPLFLTTLIWLQVVFLSFIIFSELVRAVGKAKVKKIMFG